MCLFLSIPTYLDIDRYIVLFSFTAPPSLPHILGRLHFFRFSQKRNTEKVEDSRHGKSAGGPTLCTLCV